MNRDVYAWGWGQKGAEFPWHTEYYLIIGENKKRIRDILEDQTESVITESWLNIGGFHNVFDKKGVAYHYVVLFVEWTNSPTQVALLVHEILHMAFGVFKDNKYPLPKEPNENDEEFFNDFVQLWTQRFYDALNAEDKHLHLFLFDDEKPSSQTNDRLQRIPSCPIQDRGYSERDPGSSPDKEPEIRELGAEASSSFFQSVRSGANSSEAGRQDYPSGQSSDG